MGHRTGRTRRALLLLAVGFSSGVLLFEFSGREPVLPRIGTMPDYVESPWVAPVLEMEKPASEFRAFVVGASLAYGLPYTPFGQASFATLMEKGLRGVFGRDDLHVRAEARPALDSSQIFLLSHRLLRWNPDLLIVVLGSNELLNRIVRGAPLRPDALQDRLVAALSSSVCLFEWVGSGSGGVAGGRALSFRRAVEKGRPGRSAVGGLPVGTRDRVLLAGRMREGMAKLAAACSEKKARLVFAMAVHGYAGSPPWCSELAPTSRELDELMESVIRSPREVSLDEVEPWVERFPRRADLRYARALILRRLDRGREARVEFDRALELDLAPLHRTRRIRETMRDEAQRLGLTWIDLNDALADENGITGPDRFLDYAHVDLEGQVELAVHLTRRLAGKELPVLPEGFGDAFRKAAWRHLEAVIPPREVETARPKMAQNNGIYYMFFGNFRDALPYLKLAAERLGTESPRKLHELCAERLRESRR